MNKRRIKRLLVTSLLVMEGLSLSLTYKSFSNKPFDNDIKTNDVSHKKFAMYVENSEGKYEEYTTSDLFPTGYELNLEKSNCIDNAGNVVENVISSSDVGVTVTGNKTMFCYFYFDKDSSLAAYLIDNVSETELWNSTIEDDGYRYVGTNPSNYICFGTSDKSTCTGDTDKYMYRIIGIFEDSSGNKHVKLIKKEALNTAYAWNSSNSNVDWNSSTLYTNLNGSYFLTNTSYPYMQNTTWTNKISTWNYTITNTLTYSNSGLDYYNSATVQQIYLNELNRSGNPNTNGTWTNLSTKLGLMYVSDYLLSLGSSVLSYNNYTYRSTFLTGWMHISNNDSGTPSAYEWTMSRLGLYGNYYRAWAVRSNGGVDGSAVNTADAVRPVFYLESETEYLSGSGTTSDPYMIIS